MREASAGPRNGERVASRRRAAARHTHAARTRATNDRIRAERGSGPRGKPTDAQSHTAGKASRWSHGRGVADSVPGRNRLRRRRGRNGEILRTRRVHNQSDCRRVRKASAGPSNGERVASRQRAATGRHAHGA